MPACIACQETALYMRGTGRSHHIHVTHLGSLELASSLPVPRVRLADSVLRRRTHAAGPPAFLGLAFEVSTLAELQQARGLALSAIGRQSCACDAGVYASFHCRLQTRTAAHPSKTWPSPAVESEHSTAARLHSRRMARPPPTTRMRDPVPKSCSKSCSCLHAGACAS